MSKHTPGPWTITGVSQETGSLSVGTDTPRIVIAVVPNAASAGAIILGRAPDTQWANAHLIAAAPEMLEALKAIAEATHRRQLPITSEINDLAMAAIAKATLGGQ